MARSASRRSLRARVGLAAVAAAVAVSGQLVASGPARAAAQALIQSRPSLVYIDDTGNVDGGDIKVLDPATDTVVSTILDVKHPLGLAVSPDGATLYTQNGASGPVVAIDTESQAIRATLPVTGPVQGAWLAVDPAGKSLYVGGSGQVTVVDTHTYAVTATIPVAGSVIGMFVDPSGGHAYAIVQYLSERLKIAVIDTATDTVTRTITSFFGPSAVVFNASGTRAYIPDDVTSTVSVLDTATDAVLATIPVGNAPSAAALTPSGAKLYVTNPGDQTVSVIDTATDTVTATITSPVIDIGVVMSADGTEAYVNNNIARTVSVIDTATDTISGSVPVGFYPQHMAVYNGNGGKCPCSVFKEYATPSSADSGDFYPVTVGVRVSPSAAGWIDGVRFYKASANTGTHTGALWTGDGGRLLATGTFTDETATGWQTLMFANPVPVKPGATYVASYYAPHGHYSYDVGYFLNNSAGAAPITAVSSSAGGNGVYTYDGPTAFPGYSYNAPNYWVDVIFDDAHVPTAPPTVTGTAPVAGATGASATAPVTATFSAPVDTASVHFSVADAGSGSGSGTEVPGTVSYNSTDTTATFTPSTQLPAGTVFTASIQASDAWGNAMSGPVTWNFTTSATPPSYQCPCSLFPGTGTPPGIEDSNDPGSVELGVRFVPAVNGTVTGIRFYKGANASGVHTGTLWNDATGTAIATGTFTNETASGWQTMTFANPVPVTAGIAYYASYHAPSGHYSYTTGYFTYEHQTYPLTAPASTSKVGNGTYGYGSPIAFPGASGNGTNYWVDPVFTAS